MPEPQSNPPETVLVGRVVRAHGLRGDVLVEVLSDVGTRFEPGARVLVCHGSGLEELEILRSRPYKDHLRVCFAGLQDRTAAEGLRGAELVVERKDVPMAPEGSFYYFELMECSCHDVHAGDLGEVVGIVEDGGGLLLEVARAERRLLVPFVRSFVIAVDIGARRIELDLPPGLIETCAST